MPNELTFFPVTGDFQAVTNPSIAGSSPYPVVQPVSGLVTFTPRLLKGQLFYVDDYLITVAYNTRQTVQLLENPTQGTWKLYESQVPSTSLSYFTPPDQLETYLEAQSDIGAGNVAVLAGIAPLSYDIEFTGALASAPFPRLTATSSLFDGNGNATPVSVAVTDTGSPQISRDTAIAAPTITARIHAGVLSTIDTFDTEGVELLANSAVLGNPDALIYDVMFDLVTYNGVTQTLAPFAFEAPLDNSAVCITDPSLNRLEWQPPSNVTWRPTAP